MVAVYTNRSMIWDYLSLSLQCYITLCGDFPQVGCHVSSGEWEQVSGIKYKFNRDTQQLVSLTYADGAEISAATRLTVVP